ncbi:MAG: DUF4268 domain-containing protein [Weeksellaceae bacterium]
MFSKEEASQIRRKFWTSFGQYMKLQPLDGEGKVNWINYKTGIPGLEFKTDVDNKSAVVRVEINHRDLEIQALIFEQFMELKAYFEAATGDDWIWLQAIFDDNGKPVCRIEKRLENISVFNEKTWPEIITFLKENLMKMNEFWVNVKDIFEIFK